MKTKSLPIIFLCVVILLLIPLITMQFTTAVNWKVMDFVVAAVLLLGAGLLVNLIWQKTNSKKSRGILLLALLLAFVLFWAELAVGIIGTPLSGN